MFAIEQPRGLLVLSDDDCQGLVWLAGDTEPRPIERTTLVGAPLRFIGGPR